jgi:hypothetical protein
MSEDRLLNELSSEALRSDIEHIADNIPSRLAGSARGRETAAYSRRRLEQNGAQARVDAFPALVSFPEAGECKATDPVRLSIPAYTLGHSVQTAEGGVAGALIDVGSAGPSDLSDGRALIQSTLAQIQ